MEKKKPRRFRSRLSGGGRARPPQRHSTVCTASPRIGQSVRENSRGTLSRVPQPDVRVCVVRGCHNNNRTRGAAAADVRADQGGDVHGLGVQHDGHAEPRRQRPAARGRLHAEVVLAAHPVRLQLAAEALPVLGVRADVHGEGGQPDRAVPGPVRERALQVLSGAQGVRLLVAGRAQLLQVSGGEQPRAHVHGGAEGQGDRHHGAGGPRRPEVRLRQELHDERDGQLRAQLRHGSHVRRVGEELRRSVGDRLGHDLFRGESRLGPHPYHRRWPRQSTPLDKSGPLLLHGECRLGPSHVLGPHVDVLLRDRRPRGRPLERQLRLRLPPHLLLRDGRQRLVGQSVRVVGGPCGSLVAPREAAKPGVWAARVRLGAAGGADRRRPRASRRRLGRAHGNLLHRQPQLHHPPRPRPRPLLRLLPPRRLLPRPRLRVRHPEAASVGGRPPHRRHAAQRERLPGRRLHAVRHPDLLRAGEHLLRVQQPRPVAAPRVQAGAVGLPAAPPHVALHRRQHRLLDMVDEDGDGVAGGAAAAGPQEAAAGEDADHAGAEIRAPASQRRQHEHHQQTFDQVARAPEAQGAPREGRGRDRHLVKKKMGENGVFEV